MRHFSKNVPRWSKISIIAVLFLTLLAGGIGRWYGFIWNMTPSVPTGLYRYSEPFTGSSKQRGAYAVFCPPDNAVVRRARQSGFIASGPCPGGFIKLIKKIVGMPGDTIEIDGLVCINRFPLPHSTITSLWGNPAFAKKKTIRLGEDEVWVMSDYNDQSFDSRYFGALKITSLSNIYKRASAILY